MFKCPHCGESNYSYDDTDSLGNDWYECDDCGDTFCETDAEWIGAVEGDDV